MSGLNGGSEKTGREEGRRATTNVWLEIMELCGGFIYLSARCVGASVWFDFDRFGGEEKRNYIRRKEKGKRGKYVLWMQGDGIRRTDRVCWKKTTRTVHEKHFEAKVEEGKGHRSPQDEHAATEKGRKKNNIINRIPLLFPFIVLPSSLSPPRAVLPFHPS